MDKITISDYITDDNNIGKSTNVRSDTNNTAI